MDPTRTQFTDLNNTGFTAKLKVMGPFRSPAQMLADQVVDGHASVHDGDQAAGLGLAGAPIEGPTHFSQFDPLATAIWGTAWFERGCISSHFRTMVVEGEQVQATLITTGPQTGRIEAYKADGSPVLEGSVSLGPDHPPTALDLRRDAQGDPGDLFIIDQLEVGMLGDTDRIVSMGFDEHNGPAYPFSQADKVAKITEPHPWYTPQGAASSPWGRAILPIEMISVIANKSSNRWPVRSPVMGLFLDLEIKLIHGPVFLDQTYRLHREVIGLSQSRKTESYWVRTTLTDTDTEKVAAEVTLHSGVFKASYPDYPTELLT
jgi:hypothetical protein